MSDIGLDWGPLDYLALALIIGAPGLALGAALGALEMAEDGGTVVARIAFLHAHLRGEQRVAAGGVDDEG